MSEAIWRHKKRGFTYNIVGEARVQCAEPINEDDRLTIYRSLETGCLWARPVAEFHDGRFEQITAAPPATVAEVEGLVKRANTILRGYEVAPDQPSLLEHAIAILRPAADALTSMKRMCDSYADENQRLADRAEAAEARLAECEVREAATNVALGGALKCCERLTEERNTATARIEALEKALNTPELHDFSAGVRLEAAHQRERWGATHDAGKEPQDWFWLIGYLAGKALAAHSAGNNEKALHHTISTAAACANWHAAISGADNTMRPGIDPVERGIEARAALSNKGEG